ncbi:MAG: hypothetical protein ACOYN3_02180 [Acidimicrobiia bacterium]
MRVNCKHYDSRTYATGDVVRRCLLDLAPEAPWRCPDECSRFEMRVADVGWVFGSLAAGEVTPEPEPQGEGIAELLDAAEDIINFAALDVANEEAARAEKKRRKKKRK